MPHSFSYAEYNLCKERFCIGCLREISHIYDEDFNASLCLKGYLKAFYLRTIYRRSELDKTYSLFHLMHIIFCLFITPLYIGFLSHLLGLNVHPNKNRTKDKNDDRFSYQIIYSILRGLLMFPYIILFLPFMIILLITGIFSYKYYLYIFIMYVTSLFQGINPLINVGDN